MCNKSCENCRQQMFQDMQYQNCHRPCSSGYSENRDVEQQINLINITSRHVWTTSVWMHHLDIWTNGHSNSLNCVLVQRDTL